MPSDTDESVGALLGRLDDAPREVAPKLHRAVVESVEWWGTEDGATVEAAMEGLGGSDPRVRAAVLPILGRLAASNVDGVSYDREAVATAVFEATADDHGSVRQSAVNPSHMDRLLESVFDGELSPVPTARVAGRLLELLGDPVPVVRKRVAALVADHAGAVLSAHPGAVDHLEDRVVDVLDRESLATDGE